MKTYHPIHAEKVSMSGTLEASQFVCFKVLGAFQDVKNVCCLLWFELDQCASRLRQHKYRAWVVIGIFVFVCCLGAVDKKKQTLTVSYSVLLQKVRHIDVSDTFLLLHQVITVCHLTAPRATLRN